MSTRFFSYIGYGSVWIATSFLVFTFSAWLSNREMIAWIVSESGFQVSQTASLLVEIFFGLGATMSGFGLILLLAVSILFGLNVMLLWYYITKMRRVGGVRRASATSVSGLLSGLLGIGCASCGSVVLMALFGQFGAAGLLAVLPLHGEEFSILAVGILLYTTYVLINKIKGPAVCEVI